MVSQHGCGESLTCAAMPSIAILVSRLWVKVDGLPLLIFFSWKKPTFPILSPHFFCVTKKSCKITSANDILSKGEVQNVSPEIRAYY